MNLNFLNDEKNFSIAIRDPVWKHIWLTPELRDIAQSEAFLRLYRIKQLGPAEYVYPGATHTRAAHSFGVYHLALKMLRVLIARGADEWVTEKGCCSFLAAALLHDLGHFPFTHSLKELPLIDHETLTAEIMMTEPLKGLIAAAGADPLMACAIIDKELPCPPPDGEETIFFRNLLSGVLDPDKLDYLNRDAYYCGVPYGIQDIDYILSRIEPDKKLGIVLSSKSIMSIESILFSKYLMYRSVYWHKQVRMATAMMKKCVYAALEKKLIQSDSLYSLDDSGIYSLIESLDFPEKELASSVRNRVFFTVIAEFHFDGTDPHMAKLENLHLRAEAERTLAEALSILTDTPVTVAHVLIDIPERITFESNLVITDENRIFSESSTVFSGNLVHRFTSSLRFLRIALHPKYASRLQDLDGLDEKLAKSLNLSYNFIQGSDLPGRNV